MTWKSIFFPYFAGLFKKNFIVTSCQTHLNFCWAVQLSFLRSLVSFVSVIWASGQFVQPLSPWWSCPAETVSIWRLRDPLVTGLNMRSVLISSIVSLAVSSCYTSFFRIYKIKASSEKFSFNFEIKQQQDTHESCKPVQLKDKWKKENKPRKKKHFHRKLKPGMKQINMN